MEEKLTFRAATHDNWNDIQELFGEKGAYGGCWCTYFRLTRAGFSSLSNMERKSKMNKILSDGGTPGILAYIAEKPVGWCSIAPRREFILLERSRILKPVDDKEVWSIVCFYVNKQHRRQGVMSGLIYASVEFAKSQGARVVEAYPIDTVNGGYPDPYAYTGILSAFKEAGFSEVARRSPKRPIMRIRI